MSKKHYVISENHRRAVGIALAGMDEVLCAIEAWANGREAQGVLYSEKNDLPAHRRESLRTRVREAREVLAEARDRLGLRANEARASADVWSQCCALRDTLSELGAQHMKGYGNLPPELARYMDGLSARLVSAIDRLAEEAKSGT